MTSLHLRMTPGDSGGIAIHMPANAFRGKADGRERILDFVGDALCDFLPRHLALGAQQFCHIFQHQDAAALAARQIQRGNGCGEIQHALRAAQLEFGCGRAHALAAAHQQRQLVRQFLGEGLTPGACRESTERSFAGDKIDEGAVCLEDAHFRIESDDAVGDGLENCFQFAAALFEGEVRGGELCGGAFGQRAALFQVGGHVIEGVGSARRVPPSRLPESGDCSGRRQFRPWHRPGPPPAGSFAWRGRAPANCWRKISAWSAATSSIR